MVGADVELPVFVLGEALIITDFLELSSLQYTILEQDETMVRADMELPVLELDDEATFVTNVL
jgi:hypothetical protein